MTQIQEEKPLTEVIKEVMRNRRDHYLTKIEETFRAIYRSGDCVYIERFEKLVSELSKLAKDGNLEGVVLKSIEESKKEEGKKFTKGKIKRKPKLTQYQYARAKEKGMTNEEIKEKYRLDHPRQLSGFAGWYFRWYKNKK